MRKTPRGWIQISESRTWGVARIPLGLKPSRDSCATSWWDSPIWIQPLGVFRYIICLGAISGMGLIEQFGLKQTKKCIKHIEPQTKWLTIWQMTFSDSDWKLLHFDWNLFVSVTFTALVQTMAWRPKPTGDKPISGPMMTQFTSKYMCHPASMFLAIIQCNIHHCPGWINNPYCCWHQIWYRVLEFINVMSYCL